MKKKAMLFLLLCCFMGCKKAGDKAALPPSDDKMAAENTQQEKIEDTKVTVEAEEKDKISTWIVYWDMEQAAEEIAILGDACDTISYFEAYFDGEYHVTVPNGFLEACEEMELSEKETYLTFVNDVVYGDGKENDLKDTKVLKTLFLDEASMESHIDELIALTKSAGADGLEIDYENIREDRKLWERFEVFAELLAERAQKEQLSLRIVLESMTPFEQLTLPENAEYVVMCYNLHGGTGDIGAKADKAFLKETVEAAKALDRKVTFAVAAGGFDWWENGSKVQAVREEEAAAYIREYQVEEVKRDPESYAVYFSYVDESGNTHEVWYADGRTLLQWRSWIYEAGGEKTALWRIGGNQAESLQKMLEKF